jgi:transposase
MRPISQEVRDIIIAAKERGEKVEDIALWTGVATSSVHNICRLHRETGSSAAKPYPGRRSVLTEDMLCLIRSAVESRSDITLEELIEEYHLPIKKSWLSLILIGMGFSFKKRLCIRRSSSGRT